MAITAVPDLHSELGYEEWSPLIICLYEMTCGNDVQHSERTESSTAVETLASLDTTWCEVCIKATHYGNSNAKHSFSSVILWNKIKIHGYVLQYVKSYDSI